MARAKYSSNELKRNVEYIFKAVKKKNPCNNDIILLFKSEF